MASASNLPPARHVEFKKGGWGAAIFTCVLTAAVFCTAWYIHAQTYRKPTDVMMQTFPRTEAAAAGEHGNAGHGAAAGAQAGEHGAPAAQPAAPAAQAPASH